MNTYAAYVLLRNADGQRTHSVCVVLRAEGPEQALTLAEQKALATRLDAEDWVIEDSHLVDEHVIDMECHATTDNKPQLYTPQDPPPPLVLFGFNCAGQVRRSQFP